MDHSVLDKITQKTSAEQSCVMICENNGPLKHVFECETLLNNLQNSAQIKEIMVLQLMSSNRCSSMFKKQRFPVENVLKRWHDNDHSQQLLVCTIKL